MKDFEPIDIEQLKVETDRFLGWVESHKTGFLRKENETLASILAEAQKLETIEQKVEHITTEVRAWIELWWNPDIVGKTLIRQSRRDRETERAQVIVGFPKQLEQFVETLGHFNAGVEHEKFRELEKAINERINDCLEFMKKTDAELQEAKEEKAKKSLLLSHKRDKRNRSKGKPRGDR